jgi:protein gp37
MARPRRESMSTKIEWTNTLPGYKGETWNPVIGCSKVSAGCDNCYAITQAIRIQRMGGKGGATYEGTTTGDDWSGVVKCLPERLDHPLGWRKPRLVFVNSMSDLFHQDVPMEFVLEVWYAMAQTQQHTYQVLTKRPQRMAKLVSSIAWDDTRLEEAIPYYWPGQWEDEHGDLWDVDEVDLDGGGETPLPNVWLGTSIESDRYTFRADHLRRTPAAVRFLSLEPLLGPLPSLDLTGIDWVIVGGESGPGARPMHPDWARDIRDRCIAAGVPFFFKQWGEHLPVDVFDAPDMVGGRAYKHEGRCAAVVRTPGGVTRTMQPGDRTGAGTMLDADTMALRIGKKAAGRELDGRTWDEMPEVTT